MTASGLETILAVFAIVETTRNRAFLLFTLPHPHSKVKPQPVQLPHLRKTYGLPRYGWFVYQV